MFLFISGYISKLFLVIVEILSQSVFHSLPIHFLVFSQLLIFHVNIEVYKRASYIVNLFQSIKVEKLIVQIIISIYIFIITFIYQRMPGNKEGVESSLLLLLISARASSNCIKEDFQLFLNQLLIFFKDRNFFELTICVIFD